MRQMILVLNLSPEEEALFQGRPAMVVALNDQEKEVLLNNIGGIMSYLRFNQTCLGTLQQVLESTGDREGQIEKTLTMMREPARAASDLIDAIAVLLGRAVFVGPKQEKGPVQ